MSGAKLPLAYRNHSVLLPISQKEKTFVNETLGMVNLVYTNHDLYNQVKIVVYITFVQAPSSSADSRLLKSYSPGKGVSGTLENF